MPIRRRRPLLRAAAIGGTAYMAGKRQAESRQTAVEPEPAGDDALGDATMDRLRQLGELHERGVLTDDEFAAQKARLLAQ